MFLHQCLEVNRSMLHTTISKQLADKNMTSQFKKIPQPFEVALIFTELIWEIKKGRCLKVLQRLFSVGVNNFKRLVTKTISCSTSLNLQNLHI